MPRSYRPHGVGATGEGAGAGAGCRLVARFFDERFAFLAPRDFAERFFGDRLADFFLPDRFFIDFFVDRFAVFLFFAIRFAPSVVAPA